MSSADATEPKVDQTNTEVRRLSMRFSPSLQLRSIDRFLRDTSAA
jgi:hypothetical protein